jgi:hypothetical protein
VVTPDERYNLLPRFGSHRQGIYTEIIVEEFEIPDVSAVEAGGGFDGVTDAIRLEEFFRGRASPDAVIVAVVPIRFFPVCVR